MNIYLIKEAALRKIADTTPNGTSSRFWRFRPSSRRAPAQPQNTLNINPQKMRTTPVLPGNNILDVQTQGANVLGNVRTTQAVNRSKMQMGQRINNPMGAVTGLGGIQPVAQPQLVPNTGAQAWIPPDDGRSLDPHRDWEHDPLNMSRTPAPPNATPQANPNTGTYQLQNSGAATQTAENARDIRKRTIKTYDRKYGGPKPISREAFKRFSWNPFTWLKVENPDLAWWDPTRYKWDPVHVDEEQYQRYLNDFREKNVNAKTDAANPDLYPQYFGNQTGFWYNVPDWFKGAVSFGAWSSADRAKQKGHDIAMKEYYKQQGDIYKQKQGFRQSVQLSPEGNATIKMKDGQTFSIPNMGQVQFKPMETITTTDAKGNIIQQPNKHPMSTAGGQATGNAQLALRQTQINNAMKQFENTLHISEGNNDYDMIKASLENAALQNARTGYAENGQAGVDAFLNSPGAQRIRQVLKNRGEDPQTIDIMLKWLANSLA